ncbi:MAG: LysE family translocator [Bacteroidales bacterium]|nr:LysE family translocator [Bacteroidales bacterium]MDY5780483.1 LysE family transporter [Candidatus Cryptobacteroides sp.]
MMLDILKGLLIGICASVPLGPIAILVLQKSLSEGHRAGFMAGLGACLVDTLYAVIAMFALAFAESFIEDHRILIMVGGGIIVILLGCSMAFKDPFRKMKEEHQTPSYSLKDFFQAVIMGISNPGAIFVIFALFAFFGIQLEPHDFRVAPILLSLSGGSALYWFLFSWAFSRFRKNFKLSTLLWLNRAAGVIVIIIGIALVAEGVLDILFLR